MTGAASITGTVALVRYEDPDDPEKVRAELAMCNSRQLAPSIANKSSTLGEIAALLASITAFKMAVKIRPFTAFTEATSTVKEPARW